MLAVYAISFEITLYVLLALSLKFICSSGSKRNRNNDMIPKESPNITTLNSNQMGPSYKKRNLTIQIPNESSHPEENSDFLQKYFKVIPSQYQCFPLLVFTDPQSELNKIERVTIWFSVVCLETFVNSLIFIEESMFISSLVSCLICMPVSAVLTLIFGVTLPKSESFEPKQLIPFVLCAMLMISSALFAMFVEIQGEIKNFIVSCLTLVVLDVMLLEPLKTLVKAIGFMIFKDLGFFHKFCDKV